MFDHTAVMMGAAGEQLAIRPDGLYVDATVGSGNHARMIMRRALPHGRLIAIDRDREALERSRIALAEFGDRVRFHHARFDALEQLLRDDRIDMVDGILADLGINSEQLRPERGFSFMQDGPLDMRMDQSSGEPLSSVLASLTEEQLANIIFELGDERYSRRIARVVKQAQRDQRLHTTADLTAAISAAVPAAYRHGRINHCTRSFQALRKYINDEAASLSSFLQQTIRVLRPGGRLVVISFESIEDRQVKQAFRAFLQEGLATLPHRKPLVADEAECRENPRARSAKLRTMERVAS